MRLGMKGIRSVNCYLAVLKEGRVVQVCLRLILAQSASCLSVFPVDTYIVPKDRSRSLVAEEMNTERSRAMNSDRTRH